MATSKSDGGKKNGKAEVRRLGGKTTSKSGGLRHGRHADLTDDRLPKTAGDKTGRTTKHIGRPPAGKHRKGQ